MNWLKFLLSHSIFISFCAVGLCYQTFELLHLPLNNIVFAIIFFATLCSYNFYWLISKYYFKGDTSTRVFLLKQFSNLFFFATAGSAMLYCLWILPAILPYMLVATSLTLLYSIPLWPVKRLAFTRRAGFLKTIVLALTWTYVTVMIPAATGNPGNVSVLLLFTARFLFMLMLCIIFDSRDINVDKIHALRSLATDVSAITLKKIMSVIFILYVATGLVLRYFFDNAAQVIAFFITGILTLLVYKLSLKKQNYYFYYFLVDGLMLFSALATYVASI
ncbi:MAG: hypothetical protein ABIO04_01130 [Ferruginibacter sp.]